MDFILTTAKSVKNGWFGKLGWVAPVILALRRLKQLHHEFEARWYRERPCLQNIYIYIYMCISISIYIYIERERERENG
jgi:hypothetical protein